VVFHKEKEDLFITAPTPSWGDKSRRADTDHISNYAALPASLPCACSRTTFVYHSTLSLSLFFSKNPDRRFFDVVVVHVILYLVLRGAPNQRPLFHGGVDLFLFIYLCAPRLWLWENRLFRRYLLDAGVKYNYIRGLLCIFRDAGVRRLLKMIGFLNWAPPLRQPITRFSPISRIQVSRRVGERTSNLRLALHSHGVHA
jgi:hypothetical protein